MVLCCVIFAGTALQTGSLTNPIRHPGDWGWSLLLDPGRVAAYGQWWRVLTASVVHLGLMHLLFNMFLIFLIGRELERFYGAWVVAGSMVAGASGGALACLLMQPGSAMGGASTIGYAFCVMLLGLARLRRQDLVAPFVLIAVNFGYTFTTGNVSLWGHVGGAVAGLLVAILLGVAYSRGPSRLAFSGYTDSSTGLSTGPVSRAPTSIGDSSRGSASVWLLALALTAIAAWVGLNGFTLS